jgi:hypothetical protein
VRLSGRQAGELGRIAERHGPLRLEPEPEGRRLLVELGSNGSAQRVTLLPDGWAVWRSFSVAPYAPGSIQAGRLWAPSTPSPGRPAKTCECRNPFVPADGDGVRLRRGKKP